jgi:hypothetical protein
MTCSAEVNCSKRWLKTAISWKPRMVCTPGSSMRASPPTWVEASSRVW